MNVIEVLNFFLNIVSLRGGKIQTIFSRFDLDATQSLSVKRGVHIFKQSFRTGITTIFF